MTTNLRTGHLHISILVDMAANPGRYQLTDTHVDMLHAEIARREHGDAPRDILTPAPAPADEEPLGFVQPLVDWQGNIRAAVAPAPGATYEELFEKYRARGEDWSTAAEYAAAELARR